jgi:hypothetical protein
MRNLWSKGRLEAVIFLGVFGLSAYFYNGYGWNQTARYDAIWAFVEPGPYRYSFVIDDFLTDPVEGFNTGDYARNPDHTTHFYPNKPPGTSLIGVPAYFALYHGERLLGLDPLSIRSVLVNAYLIHLWVTVLPVALSAIFFFRLALHFTRRRRRALLLTCLLYGGTLMLPFSTMLWGHTTAAAFVVIALAYFVQPGWRAAMLSGVFVGLAALTDYGAAPLAVVLTLASLAVRPRGKRIAGLVFGGLGPLVVFAAYHWGAFGSSFTLASSFSPGEMLEDGRLFGLFGRIEPVVLWGLTLSSTKGLFFHMPVLVLSLYALRFAGVARGKGAGKPGGAQPIVSGPTPTFVFWGLSVATILLVLLVNASFNGWHGGLSTGPRYQIVVLPFWVLLLALLPERRGVRVALYALAAISFANMFVAAAVSPAAPETFHRSPLLFCYNTVWNALRVDLGFGPASVAGGTWPGSLHVPPDFLMRDWPTTLADPVVQRWASFNLGERLLGLRGTLSLLPALLGSLGVVVWAGRLAGRQDAEAQGGAAPSTS